MVPKLAKDPPEICSLDAISRIFQSQFQIIHIVSVSGHCTYFLIKICQSVASISVIGQFYEFYEFNLWPDFANWPHCELELRGCAHFDFLT